MASLNKATLIGRLGRDPEIRTASNGNKIANFSVATSESWRDKSSGERKEKTFWHNIVIFNENIVKVAEQYLKKGNQVYIEGAIQSREYTDRDGNKKYTTEIVIEAFRGQLILLGGKDGANGRPSAEGPEDYGSTRTRSSSGPSKSTGELIDDSIPF